MVELDGVLEKEIIDQKVMELSVLLIQHSDYAAERSTGSLICFCGILDRENINLDACSVALRPTQPLVPPFHSKSRAFV
jgi:hypothetical protein